MTNASQVAETMQELFADLAEMDHTDRKHSPVFNLANSMEFENCESVSNGEAGLMTYNDGFVLRTPDGHEFQITIVQSR